MNREIAQKIINSSYVIGLDVGQNNIGVAEIYQGNISATAYSGENNFLSRWRVSRDVKEFYLSGARLPVLVVIEEYTKQRFSHVSFGMGENGGIYRCLVWEMCIPILLCPVPLMRSFYGVKRKTKKIKSVSGKEAMAGTLKDWLNVTSNAELKRDRENEIDAVAYAFIGACYLYWKGAPELNEMFDDKQIHVLESLDKKYYLG